jgi:glycosyltransferase involved in cell wall biosynthesis
MVPTILGYLSRNPDTSWVVAGGGKYLDSRKPLLLDCPRKEGGEEHIHLPGFVTDVSSLYDTTDVFVYWSYRDGYPNVILEIQVHQTPVITNPDFGMEEQVEHKESGLHVEIENEKSLVDAIQSVLSDSKFAESLGQGGYRRVSSENDPKVIGRRYKEIINESIAWIHNRREKNPETAKAKLQKDNTD